MAVLAHPDDETLYCGGFLAKAARSGEQVITVTLTRGEMGRTLGVCEPEALADVRTSELRRAAEVLGVTRTEVFDLRDGRLGEHEIEAVSAVQGMVKAAKPQTLVAFPPNGLNGHPDHVVAHRIALMTVQDASAIRVLLLADDHPFSEAPRPGYLSPKIVNRLRLPSTMAVDLGDVVELKLRALGQYETQARSVTKFLRRHAERFLEERFHELGRTDQASEASISFLT